MCVFECRKPARALLIDAQLMLSAQRSNTIQSDFGHWPSIGQITLVGWRELSSDWHILTLYFFQINSRPSTKHFLLLGWLLANLEQTLTFDVKVCIHTFDTWKNMGKGSYCSWNRINSSVWQKSAGTNIVWPNWLIRKMANFLTQQWAIKRFYKKKNCLET